MTHIPTITLIHTHTGTAPITALTGDTGITAGARHGLTAGTEDGTAHGQTPGTTLTGVLHTGDLPIGARIATMGILLQAITIVPSLTVSRLTADTPALAAMPPAATTTAVPAAPQPVRPLPARRAHLPTSAPVPATTPAAAALPAAAIHPAAAAHPAAAIHPAAAVHPAATLPAAAIQAVAEAIRPAAATQVAPAAVAAAAGNV